MATTDLDLAVTKNGQALPNVLSPVDDFELLDQYAGGIADETPRIEALATISAGDREQGQDGKPGKPRVSRNGKIILHDRTGRAPALKAALEATDYKRLTVAFPWNDPRDFIQQRFVSYSASHLLAYGDERSITVLGAQGRRTYDAGTTAYREAAQSCKVLVSCYFALAGWDEQGPAVLFPDGVGALYRLRFTSRNSLRSIVSTLRQVARFTRGRLAGVPFDLALDYREVSGPDGSKRLVPVWTITMRPPGTFRLDSRNFAQVMQGALAQGSALMLPPPSQETLEVALQEEEEPDLDSPSDVQLAQLEAGGTCDEAYWRSRWHAIAEGTRFDDPRARAAFLDEFTQGQTDSLKEFLANSTEAQAQALITDLEIALARNVVPVSAAAPLQQRSGAGVGFQGKRLPEEDERSMQALFGHALKPRHEQPSTEYAADFAPDRAYDLEDEDTHAEQQAPIEQENIVEPAPVQHTRCVICQTALTREEIEGGETVCAGCADDVADGPSESQPVVATTYTCEGCGQDLVSWINPTTGEVAQPAEIAERTRAKYDQLLCPTCATARSAKSKKRQ